MGGFLAGIGKIGKAAGRMEKKRLQQKYGVGRGPASSGSAGADPVADAVQANLRKKRTNGKGRD